MPDKYDPEIAKLVEDIHTDISRISASIEEIKRALDYITSPPIPRPSPTPRTTSTAIAYRSGRWPIASGTFAAGASGITPGPSTHADSPPRDLRSPLKR